MRIVLMAASALILSPGLTACGQREPEPGPAAQFLETAEDSRAFPSINSPEVLADPMNHVVRAIYACDNAENLTVDFDNPRNMATARTSNGMAVDLHQQKAASGYWYRAGGYEMRGRRGDITWTMPEALPAKCKVIR